MKKYRLTIPIILSIILELLPYSAILYFGHMAENGEPVYSHAALFAIYIGRPQFSVMGIVIAGLLGAECFLVGKNYGILK